jgi:hypothetical protein
MACPNTTSSKALKLTQGDGFVKDFHRISKPV